MGKILTLENLEVFQEKNKQYINEKDAKSIKSAKFENNVISLYTTEDMSGTAVVTLNLPEEYFLDQTKTKFVTNFTWSNTLYPGSINPELEGKKVLVLAVKGDTTVSYSFVSIDVPVYTGGSTSTATTTITDGEIKTAAKISSAEGNSILTKDDGLYVPEIPVLEFATDDDIAGLWD